LWSHLVHVSSKDESEVSLKIPKVKDLSSYRNLSGFAGPDGDGRDLLWHTTGSVDAHALATIHRKLPFQVHVTYFLNGKQVKPDKINGKDGRLRISVEVVNASERSKTVTYKALTNPELTGTVEQYIPFEYALRITFPNDRWTAMNGSRMDVEPVGNTQVAAATGVLSPPLTEATDTVDVSAHSTNMLRPRIQVYAFPKLNPNLLGALDTQYDALKA